MRTAGSISRQSSRVAAATVELAILLPFLMFLFVIAVDYGRVFYFSQVVTNCARNGAVYAGDPTNAAFSPYTTLQDAARADAPEWLRKSLTVTSTSGSDVNGEYINVTVRYTFQTLSRFPGIPNQVNVTRTVQARVAPMAPR